VRRRVRSLHRRQLGAEPRDPAGSLDVTMAPRYDTVTFLSDYGRVDEFVGVVHSVIRSIAPGATVIDLTHDIHPYDVRAGALALARSVPFLCPGVVVGVVDPAVGTTRRPIAVEVGDGASVLVGPDNGLLAPAVAMCGGATRAVVLTSPDHRLDTGARTFDGRDVFAPAAAHLCNGVDLLELGPEIDPVSLMPGLVPLSRTEADEVVAEVLWVDRYGNVQLNVEPEELVGFEDRVAVVIEGDPYTARRAGTFAEVAPGEIGMLVDSYGLLALALDRDSAARELGVTAGSSVLIRNLDDDRPTGVTTPVTLSVRRTTAGEEGQP
jgi:S-adenosylmethionine hydrolase